MRVQEQLTIWSRNQHVKGEAGDSTIGKLEAPTKVGFRGERRKSARYAPRKPTGGECDTGGGRVDSLLTSYRNPGGTRLKTKMEASFARMLLSWNEGCRRLGGQTKKQVPDILGEQNGCQPRCGRKNTCEKQRSGIVKKIVHHKPRGYPRHPGRRVGQSLKLRKSEEKSITRGGVHVN